MTTNRFIYSSQTGNGPKGGGGASPSHDEYNNEDKRTKPSEGEKEETSLADETTLTGDLDGGGGVGSGVAGGDPDSESGDEGPTPDKAANV